MKKIKFVNLEEVCSEIIDCPHSTPKWLEKGIPVIQLERKLTEINDVVEESLKKRLQNEFGVTVSSVDIDAIDIDKTSDG